LNADAEVSAEFGQCAVGALRHRGSEGRLVAPVEGHAALPERPGGGFAGRGPALLEPPHPRFADRKLVGDDPCGEAAIDRGQHPVAQILRVRTHESSS